MELRQLYNYAYSGIVTAASAAAVSCSTKVRQVRDRRGTRLFVCCQSDVVITDTSQPRVCPHQLHQQQSALRQVGRAQLPSRRGKIRK